MAPIRIVARWAILMLLLLTAAPVEAQLCGTANVSPRGGPPGTTIRFSAGGWYGGCHADDPYFWIIDGQPYYWYQVVKTFSEIGHHTWSFCTWQAGCSQCCDDGSFEISGPAAPTPTPGPDLVAEGLEITQGIQDTANSVRLVAGKPTYVRFHVRSRQGDHLATARLRVRTGSSSRVLYPLDSGSEITVRPNPRRAVRADSFLFGVPSGFAKGNVTFIAEVNPGDLPTETDRTNNEITTTVTFESVPRFALSVYAVRYTVGANVYEARDLDVFQLLFWLQNAYPIPGVQLTRRTLDVGAGFPLEADINRALVARSLLDLARGSTTANTRHLGLASDGGRVPFNVGGGLAGGIPSAVATAFTGPPAHVYAWDSDGSYGDWLAGHELGHTLGRSHAEFCGARAANADGTYPPGYVAYPYPDGKLSPPQGATDQFLGFDIHSRQVIAPPRYELMTYCYNFGRATWISDFTYEGILDRLQLEGGGAAFVGPSAKRLLVVGTLDESRTQLDLETPVALDDMPAVAEATGPIDVVLRDAMGGELVRQAARVDESQVDTPDGGRTVYHLSALVPYAEGAARLDVEEGGVLLASIGAGPAAPRVTWLEPSPGASLPDGDVRLVWNASDADGDPVTTTVQYSDDDGATWRVVAQNVHTSDVMVDRRDLVAGERVHFRLLASDGIHTSTTDLGPLRLANGVPTIAIEAPPAESTIVASQGVGLRAVAYDVDDGLLDESVSWSSDRSGVLGSGAMLQLASLTVGRHVITAQAADADGISATASVVVNVVSTPNESPDVASALVVEPTALSMTETDDVVLLYVGSVGSDVPLAWTATADVAWLELSKLAGDTPDDLAVRLRPTMLTSGEHRAVVTLRQGSQRIDVPVRVWIEGGVAACTGDCDGDATVTVDEIIKGVSIALGTTSLAACTRFDAGGDGNVTVDEIVTAVNHALAGCPSQVPTPTPTSVPSMSRTRTSTATPTLTSVPRTPTPTPTLVAPPTATVATSATPTRTATPTATATATVTTLEFCRVLAPPLAIPDADEFGVADAQWVEAPGVVSGLRVTLELAHSWVGDLQVSLVHVDELVAVTLLDRPGEPASGVGCGGDDVACTFDDAAARAAEDMCADESPALGGSLRPNESLSTLDGLPRAGHWSLQVADVSPMDTGTLQSWCLHFRSGS